MKQRSFECHVLGVLWGRPHAERFFFSDADNEADLDLNDPFVCLQFVEEQVKMRNELESVSDFKVVMREMWQEKVDTGYEIARALIRDEHTVRPWRSPKNAVKFARLAT